MKINGNYTDSEYQYEVSVVIATYNPDREKLIYTINSILIQKNIHFELVITDDGSEEDFFEEIEKYFKNRKFTNYLLHKNKRNGGTVKNINSGIDICGGEYVKLISPGDFLYGVNCLREWIDSLREGQAEMSFGDVIYYRTNGRKVESLKHKALPQEPGVYEKHGQRVIDNYLLLNDTIHGVSTICRTHILKKYMQMAAGRVTYAEDCMYRLMIKDGIRICHYPKDVVLYEFGGGISTNNSDKWKKLIKQDLQVTDALILQNDDGSPFYRKFRIAIEARDKKSIIHKIKKYVAMPDLFVRKTKMLLNKRYTNTKISEDYLNLILTDNEIGG